MYSFEKEISDFHKSQRDQINSWTETPIENRGTVKSIIQENLFKTNNSEDFLKSFSKDLQSKFPNATWRTINGAKVLINGKNVVAGLDGFNGMIDKFFDEKKSKEGGGIKTINHPKFGKGNIVKRENGRTIIDFGKDVGQKTLIDKFSGISELKAQVESKGSDGKEKLKNKLKFYGDKDSGYIFLSGGKYTISKKDREQINKWISEDNNKALNEYFDNRTNKRPKKPKKTRSEKNQEEKVRSQKNHSNRGNEQNIKNSILSINGLVLGDRYSTGYQIISENLAEIKYIAKEKNNQFIQDIAQSVNKYMKASEKQAYALGKFAHDNGLIEEWGEPKLRTKNNLPKDAIVGNNIK